MTSRDRLSDGVLTAFATAGYLALLVAGLGVASLALDEDVIRTRGVGLVPAYVAAGAALAVFALLVRQAVARERPTYVAAAGVALASAATHALVLGAGALLDSGDLGVALGAVSEVLVGWVEPVVALTAAVAAWAAIAVRRTGAERPRWPWEDSPR
ncbi:hypothetical protein [Microbacterium sp. ZXX196]|uniref:hypothetical protein n=1 Tax=Microbacterium sp. ZXX196 TaxID=2609291 RepID=UPI0012B927FE|nr:hypothetical protein [Microbacterium sp. ZXX196]MTE23549.1 hypothetical protein [Microbacterium sp. ZXX196]